MKRLISHIALFCMISILPISLHAQLQPDSWLEKNAEFRMTGDKLPQYGDAGPEQEAIRYLTTAFPIFTNEHTSLRKLSKIQSPLGWHLDLIQQFENRDIFGASIKINIGADRRILSLSYKLADTRQWTEGSKWPATSQAELQAITQNADAANVQEVWYYNGSLATQAYLFEYGNNDGSLHEVRVTDLNYHTLYLKDKRLNLNDGPDSTATGYVFYPDPLTSARVAYGIPYIDGDDSAIRVLDFERVPENMPVTYKEAEEAYFLENDYVVITELSIPVTPITKSKTPLFNYSRAEPGFEDVNAYFHINNYISHIKELGFEQLIDHYKLRVDAHALNGDDQSEFSYFAGDLKLHFGEGDIDDAEDADVIVHEYSHFLSYQASPNTVEGNERQAVEEGLCDYFACSYSRAISEYNWQKLYNWDGNESWNGRDAVTQKKYPADLVKNRYRDGTLWVSALMNIWEQIGRDETDRLMLGTLYMLGKGMSMNTVAKLYLQTDTLLNQATNAGAIKKAFMAQGLIDTRSGIADAEDIVDELKLDVSQFAANSIIGLQLPTGARAAGICLYDLGGRILFQENIHANGGKQVNLPADLAGGLYLLRVTCKGKVHSYKLFKPGY